MMYACSHMPGELLNLEKLERHLVEFCMTLVDQQAQQLEERVRQQIAEFRKEVHRELFELEKQLVRRSAI